MNTILIVEDSPIETAIYNRLLKGDFYLEFNDNAEDALETLKTKDFDLIISDVNLPGINGPEMIQTIRTDLNKAVSIAIVSSDQTGINNGMSLGANFWFLKPINPKNFGNSINMIFNKIKDKPSNLL